MATDAKTILYRCFSLLDENFFSDFKDSIDKRIIFQKYGLFFSVIFGLRFGDYSLYIHGPYNTTMADIGYEFANDHGKRYKTSARTIEFAEQVQNIIAELRTELSTNNVEFLEVFSTFFYLRNCEKENQKNALLKTERIKKDLITKKSICLSEVTEIYNELSEQINTIANTTVLA